jgi:hypothetical protein
VQGDSEMGKGKLGEVDWKELVSSVEFEVHVRGEI